MTKKVLITDGVHNHLIEGFQGRGFEVDYQPNIQLEEVHMIIEEYEGLIINSKIKVDKTLIDKATKLKFVARLGSGLEVMDLQYAASKGIHCYNTPEGNRNAVAEQALGMLLALFNNIIPSNQDVKNFHWKREENRGVELDGKTIGIIAYGNTGEAFAKKLRGFDVEVLVYDKYKTGFGNGLVKESTLEEIYSKADVLSLHLPLTDETKYWLDEERINKFEKPIWVINTSRGKCLKLEDLLKSLQNEKILGAVLDVLENEKMETLDDTQKTVIESLNILKNVIITPHIAGWTHQSKFKISDQVLRKLDDLKIY